VQSPLVLSKTCVYTAAKLGERRLETLTIFPKISGLIVQRLVAQITDKLKVQQFAGQITGQPIVQEVLAQITWFHSCVLFLPLEFGGG
jgi:hypothetical protein